MKNLPLRGVYLCIGACLFLAAGCDDDDDDGGGGGGGGGTATPSALLAAGKAELVEGDLQEAFDDFQQVSTLPEATPTQQTEAQLYLALLDLGLAFDQEGAGADAIALRELGARFGLPAEGPDVTDLDAWLSQLPDPLPEDSPDQAELRQYLVTHALPALEEAQSDLAALPPSVESTLDTGDGGVWMIDVTDVLALRTALAAAESQVQIFAAYGGGVDIDATLADDDIDYQGELLADPQFLTLQEPARLVAAQDALRRSIELYDQALASLQAEGDDQSDDVVIFGGDTPEEVMQSEQDAQELALLLDQVHAAIVAPPAAIELTNGYMLLLDLGTPFTTLQLRDELPQFDDTLEMSALATLEAPVLMGIFPAMTGLQANKALRLLVPLSGGHAIQVLPGAIDVDDGSSADWGIVPPATFDPTGMEDFTADVSDGTAAVDFAAIYVAQENTHVPSSDLYLVRLDLAGGKPSRMDNTYGFTLEPNGEGSAAPGFVGEIAGNGGDFELTIRRTDTGDVVLGPDSTLVGGGPGFLELGFAKQFFVDAGVANGTEYALQFQSAYDDPFGEDSFSDESMPIRFVIDL